MVGVSSGSGFGFDCVGCCCHDSSSVSGCDIGGGVSAERSSSGGSSGDVGEDGDSRDGSVGVGRTGGRKLK